jgi:hypothetical protein
MSVASKIRPDTRYPASPEIRLSILPDIRPAGYAAKSVFDVSSNYYESERRKNIFSTLKWDFCS